MLSGASISAVLPEACRQRRVAETHLDYTAFRHSMRKLLAGNVHIMHAISAMHHHAPAISCNAPRKLRGLLCSVSGEQVKGPAKAEQVTNQHSKHALPGVLQN